AKPITCTIITCLGDGCGLVRRKRPSPAARDTNGVLNGNGEAPAENVLSGHRPKPPLSKSGRQIAGGGAM
ncbi:MAG: hypothetical protein OXU20_34940, partial [Myxococcales bacterium]|nr:hypothetical protein [Myxococcales bacterium]